MAQAGEPADCPRCHSGHTRRRLSSISFISQSAAESIPVSLNNGGGCGCGGSCACGH